MNSPSPPPNHPPVTAPPRWHVLALFLLVLVGGGLRLWHLDAWALDGDEIETLNESIRLGRAEELHKTRSVLLTGPLVQWSCKALLGAGVPSVWALRLVPFLTSVLALAMIALGTSRLFGSRAGLAALLLLALCPLHYHASSFGRYLAPVFLCGAAGGLSLLAYLRLGRNRDLLHAVGWCLLGIGFHVTFALVAGALLVASLLVPGTRRRTVLWVGSLSAVAAVVLVLALGEVGASGFLREVSARVGELRLRSPLPLLKGLAHDLGLGVMIMAGVGWLLARRDHPREMALVAVTFLLVIGTLLLVGTRVQVGPRYLLGLVPWFLVLAGVGLDRALHAIPGRATGLALVGLTLAPAAPVFLSQLIDNSRYDVASLASVMEQEVQPGDRVLAESHDLVEYYTGLPCQEIPTRAEDLLAQMQEGPRIWLVLLLQRGRVIGTGDRRLQRLVEQNAVLRKQVTRVRLDAHQFETRLYRWDPPGASGD